jgi:hypothetical protein
MIAGVAAVIFRPESKHGLPLLGHDHDFFGVKHKRDLNPRPELGRGSDCHGGLRELQTGMDSRCCSSLNLTEAYFLPDTISILTDGEIKQTVIRPKCTAARHKFGRPLSWNKQFVGWNCSWPG